MVLASEAHDLLGHDETLVEGVVHADALEDRDEVGVPDHGEGGLGAERLREQGDQQVALVAVGAADDRAGAPDVLARQERGVRGVGAEDVDTFAPVVAALNGK